MKRSGEMTGTLREFLTAKSPKIQWQVLSKVFESLTCSICHEYMYVPMMTQCGHNYCYDCLLAWFESNPEEELSCPQCRASVINTPALNSALKQWLHTVFEALQEEEIEDDDERQIFSKLVEAKESCEQTYKQDEKNDDLFKGIFKNSAVGVVDKEDDGILRCSNCHWELEDDEDDMCPHCHLRIRSRPNVSRSGSDSEEEYSGDEFQREYIRGIPLVSYSEYATDYFMCVKMYMRNLKNPSDIIQEEHDYEKPLHFHESFLPGRAVMLYPSFSAYFYFTYSSCLMNRRIFVRIIQELEEIGHDEEELEEFIENEYRWYVEQSHDGFDEDVFRTKVKNLQKSVQAYEAKLKEYLEEYSNVSDPSLNNFHIRFPLLVRRTVDEGVDLVIPSYSVYAQCDYTLDDEERAKVVPMVRHIESHSACRRYRDTDDEMDSSMDDFIASDDEEMAPNNLVDLDASEHSSDSDSKRSHDEEELDSDYFERNEGEGFVSGDSLDDGNNEDTSEQGGDADGDDDDDDDDDEDEDSNVVHKARKRNRAIVEASEDESM